MEGIRLRMTARDWFGYTMAYLLWILTVLASLLAVLEFRNAFNMVWPLLGSGAQWGWTLRAVDRFGLVFLGLACLIYQYYAESRYRSAITNVRIREFKGKQAPALADGRANRVTRLLARLGLDLLVPRFTALFTPLVALLLVSLGTKALALHLFIR